MTELERELRDLGGRVEYPPTPDIATAVRRRLAAEPARAAFPLRRVLVIGLAVLAVAAGAVMAVPQARTAILEWLGLRGVTIERVPTQPKAPSGAELGLGRGVTLGQARSRASYEVLVPTVDRYSHPREVYFTSAAPGGQVSFVYRSDGRIRALLSQFQATLRDEFIQKSAGPGTAIERVTVNGERGYSLSGKPHLFLYVDPEGNAREETLRLARNTLLWEQRGRTLRLEGDLTKEEALRLAESMR